MVPNHARYQLRYTPLIHFKYTIIFSLAIFLSQVAPEARPLFLSIRYYIRFRAKKQGFTQPFRQKLFLLALKVVFDGFLRQMQTPC